MTVFDLHADTATVMYDHRKLLTDPSLHLHADGLSRFSAVRSISDSIIFYIVYDNAPSGV